MSRGSRHRVPLAGLLVATLAAAGCADEAPTAVAPTASATAPGAPGAANVPLGRTIYGLDDRNTLVVFEGDRPAQLTRSVPITGVNDPIVGIDFRPNDSNQADLDQTGLLYGLSSAGGVYTIDVATGAATLRARLSVPLDRTQIGLGFNPVADRLRVHTSFESNYAVNVETGATVTSSELEYSRGDAAGEPRDVNFGQNPDVVAIAHTNTVSPAPATTELYGIDSRQDVLVRTNPAGGSQLRTVGRLGLDVSSDIGFDIPGRATDRVGYATLTPPRGTRSFLYRISLDNAAREPVGPVGHDRPIISIAIDENPVPALLGRYVIPGAAVYPEGVAYDAALQAFYVGSTTDGTIYRANTRDSSAAVVLAGGGDGRTTAIGLKVDDRGRLYVAGGATGSVFIYDARRSGPPTLAGVRTRGGAAGPTFVNDVAIARNGTAYVTDSQDPVIYRIPAGATGTEPLERWLPLAGTAIAYTQGFNLNGIVATADGRYLLTVQSNTGRLYRVTVADRSIREVTVAGASLTNGDGMLLDGRTLYVVRNQNGEIVKLTLDAELTAATAVGTTSDPSFAFPTTIARAGDRLLVVNSQFDKRAPGRSPTLPFTLSSILVP